MHCELNLGPWIIIIIQGFCDTCRIWVHCVAYDVMFLRARWSMVQAKDIYIHYDKSEFVLGCYVVFIVCPYNFRLSLLLQLYSIRESTGVKQGVECMDQVIYILGGRKSPPFFCISLIFYLQVFVIIMILYRLH